MLSTTASTPLTVTFLFYILGMVAIGLIAYRYTSNLSDYILGGRRLGAFVVALSAGASDMSGWLLMGLPGAVFLHGVSESWIAIGLTIGAWCNWKWVAGRLRVYTERANNSLTLPDYFTYRFEDKSRLLRVLSAVIILLFFAVYCASGVVAGARLFESTFGIPYATAMWVGALATILYTLIGGFLAVSWTDTVQASLMIGALVVTPLVVIFLSGGLVESTAIIHRLDPSFFDMGKGGSVVGVVSLLAWGLGYFGQPHILARFMSASSYKAIAPARRISMTWMVLCLAGAVAVGFFGIAYFAEHPELAGPVAQQPERVFILLSQLLFNPWIAGVLLSAILAAIMSTLSCQLLVCSSALTEDFYKAFLRRNAGQAELVWVGRITVLLVSLLAIALARNPENSVLELVSYAWGGFGAAFGPVVVISLLWRRMTRNGALAGMLVGALTVVVWKQGSIFGVQIVPAAWQALYEILPGALLGAVAIFVVSLLDRAPSRDVLATFDAVDAEIDAYRRS
ncbi:sodium/proline symporter PutP [Uliginosibacterium sp. sgz301328]|uniref:sodium/proline symporter PutP n=1 Tax=Uliginosibacterium sp. sgz301328 TaxID=3243764 RepID=UPI00359CC61D